ncbi:hypothetical protein JTB14_029873 [Gonioctena quinquepunctata]|nr:hypothetical protein JTB14_029873 [Gonioctena quinquepunctata]
MSNSATPAQTESKLELAFKMFKKPEVPPALRVISSMNTLLDDDKNTKLHYVAAQGRNEDFTKQMLQKHTIDAENYLGWTPLMMACRNGHLKTVESLLKLSADASRKNRFGCSVFLISISSGKLEIVSLIINHLLQGGISRRNLQNVLSPLSLAILFRHQNVLEYLVSQKFDMNKTTSFTGITPLMFATAMEDTDAYNLLIKNKCHKSMKNHLGATADEIKRARNEKKEPEKEVKLTPAEMISLSPHMTALHSPYYVINPQTPFFMMNSNPAEVRIRKSSNAMTPSPNVYVTSPSVTPITPMNYAQQFFFPQEFSPGHYCSFLSASPVSVPALGNGEFLNTRMDQSNQMFLSPNYH